MKHAVDSRNREKQASQPVKDLHPFKMGAPPPRDKDRNCNVGAWKGRAGIFSSCVYKINDCLKQAAFMIIFIPQGDRSLNRQEYEDEITHVEQGGELEHEAFEELYILAG